MTFSRGVALTDDVEIPIVGLGRYLIANSDAQP
jgi:hypothetical protein